MAAVAAVVARRRGLAGLSHRTHKSTHQREHRSAHGGAEHDRYSGAARDHRRDGPPWDLPMIHGKPERAADDEPERQADERQNDRATADHGFARNAARLTRGRLRRRSFGAVPAMRMCARWGRHGSKRASIQASRQRPRITPMWPRSAPGTMDQDIRLTPSALGPRADLGGTAATESRPVATPARHATIVAATRGCAEHVRLGRRLASDEAQYGRSGITIDGDVPCADPVRARSLCRLLAIGEVEQLAYVGEVEHVGDGARVLDERLPQEVGMVDA